MAGSITVFPVPPPPPGGGGGGASDSSTTGLFDADAIPDMVVASLSTKKIQLYPMTAAGGFISSSPTFTMTDSQIPQGLAAGSFNANTDANDDLAVVVKSGDSIYIEIYYGNRAGSFPVDGSGNGVPSKEFYVPKADFTAETITSIAARDVNGDGKTDLVVTVAPATVGGDPVPKILLSNGDGTFTGTVRGTPNAASIQITPLSATIGAVGGTTQFTATAYDKNGNPIPGAGVLWSANSPTICNIDANGLATGVNPGGPVAITASVGTVKATAYCTVGAPDVKVLSLSASMSAGAMYTTATVTNSGSTVILELHDGFYLSSNNGATIGPSDILIRKQTIKNLAIGATDSTPTTTNLINIPTGAYYVKVFADYDGHLGTRDIAGLSVNQTSSATTVFPVPAAAPTGNYYVCAVTDSANSVNETDETNNTSCKGTIAIGPDLKVSSLSASKSAGKFYISDTEMNIGSQDAGSFTVNFYLSLDNTYDGANILLGSRTIAGLAGASGTNSATTILQAPTGTPTGNYYIIAVTDAGNSVAETNETNNTLSTTGTYPAP